MNTRFTRVTVVGSGRQIDISLPADAPVAEQLPAVLRLLSVPPGVMPMHWRLAAPEFGPLDPARSLDEVGVADGALLYLTEAATAPLPPFVDDVESAVADLVAVAAPAWVGAARRTTVGWLLAALLLAALAVGVASPAPSAWLMPAVVLLAALGLGRAIGGSGGWACAAVAVAAAPALVIGAVTTRPVLVAGGAAGPASGRDASLTGWAAAVAHWTGAGFPLLLIAAAAVALAGVSVVQDAAGPTAGALAVAVVAGSALVTIRAGLPVDRTAGSALVAAVLLSGLAGQVALGGAGLVDLMVADEQGRAVPRAAVAGAVRRGLGTAAGLVWAAAVIGAAACWTLLVRVPSPGTPAGWTAPALGVLGAVIFGLRSRMFSRAQQVGTMLVVPVVALVAVSVRAPGWWALTGRSADVATPVLLLVGGLLVAGFGFGTLGEVAGARLQRLLDRVEVVAVLALIPGLVLLFRVIPAVQRWWS